jgi:hypothetical protein
MKRLLSGLLGLLAMAAPALAVTQASSPPKFPLVWGQNAATAYIRSIPQNSQIGIQNCAASLNDGFPPLTSVPIAAGGCGPFLQDTNGIFKQVSQWSQWFSAGAPIYYDATWATGAANGYPNGAIVQSAIVPGDFWLSTADNNTSNPDAGGANWVPDPGRAQTGLVEWWVGPTVPYGWVRADGNTIGNASSGASSLASSTAQFLYTFLWNTFSNTTCPVSGGRGANAAADFAANKTIGIVPLYGTMLIGNDLGSGTLAGVPVISGSITTNGSYIGEVLHTITVGQLPPHTHNYSGSGTTASENVSHTHSETAFMQSSGITAAGSGGPAFLGANTGGQSTGAESNPHVHPFSWGGTTDSGTGGGAAENNTPRAMVGYWMIKL